MKWSDEIMKRWIIGGVIAVFIVVITLGAMYFIDMNRMNNKG